MENTTLSGVLENLNSHSFELNEKATIEACLMDSSLFGMYLAMIGRGMSEKNALRALPSLAETLGKILDKAESNDKAQQVTDLVEPVLDRVRADLAPIMGKLKALGFAGFELQVTSVDSQPVTGKVNLGTGANGMNQTEMVQACEIIVKPMKRRVLWKVGAPNPEGKETTIKAGYMGAVYVATKGNKVRFYHSPKTAMKFLFKATFDALALREKQGHAVNWMEKIESFHKIGTITDLRVPEEAVLTDSAKNTEAVVN